METLGLINPLQDIHGQKGKVIEDNLSSKPNNIKLNGTKHLQRFVTETLQDHVSSANKVQTFQTNIHQCQAQRPRKLEKVAPES